MAKLYFKYGTMGSSKTAQALITKFNYEKKGMKVWLLKPAIDTRFGYNIIHSRIGIEAEGDVIGNGDSILDAFIRDRKNDCDVIIIDEAQFLTEEQVDDLRVIVDEYDIPVLCFGLPRLPLRLFRAAKGCPSWLNRSQRSRQFASGVKATVNTHRSGRESYDEQRAIPRRNESYTAMCYKCWRERIKRERGGKQQS